MPSIYPERDVNIFTFTYAETFENRVKKLSTKQTR